MPLRTIHVQVGDQVFLEEGGEGDDLGGDGLGLDPEAVVGGDVEVDHRIAAHRADPDGAGSHVQIGRAHV